jgi:pimeloyl-ACP methyl ester carboxylesterase
LGCAAGCWPELELLVDGIAGEPVFQTFSTARSNAVWRNAGAMRALTRADDPFPDVARVAVRALATPCLLLQGERCSPLHLCVMEKLARELPLAEQAVIAGSGHGAPLENPAGFNEAVGTFLSRHRQS